MYTKIQNLLATHNTKLAVVISILTYLLFFGSTVLNSERSFWSSDIKNKFHPVRTYFHNEVTQQKRFPFWTEKMYAGFPIYADIENAYLHPYNILISVLFEPFTAYKIIHFTVYLFGSLGLYFLFKNKNIGLIGYAVANLIFFFNFFVINHQIHQSMILTLYTFPLSLYLLDRYFFTRNHKYTIFNILTIASAFYWGHPQMLFLYLLGMFMYLVFLIDKRSFNKKVGYMLFLGWFVFLLSLPQLLPTWELNTQSIRSSDYENIFADQGSFNPLMFSTLIYPELFLDHNSYRGTEINEEYSFTETYNYIGVSVFLVFLFSLVFLEDQKLKTYILSSFTVYLLLSYSRYVPFFRLDSIPMINLFRYWNRSVVLFIFPISLVVGQFLDRLFKGTMAFKKPDFKSVVYIFGSLFILFVMNISAEDTKQLLENIPFYLSQSYYFKEWVVISATVLGLLLFIYKFSTLKYVNFFSLILVTIIFFDLWHLSKGMIDFRTSDIGEIESVSIPDEYNNKRVIVKEGDIEANKTLYYDFWSLFGYSQFAEKKYLNKFLENEIKSIYRPPAADPYFLMHDFYSGLGVSSIILEDEIIQLNDSNLDFIANDLEGNYILKNEGHIILKLDAPSETKLQTYIKNYPGWEVMVNGDRVQYDTDSLFINFDISSGISTIDMQFKPKVFYLGLAFSFLGLGVSLISLQRLLVRSRHF